MEWVPRDFNYEADAWALAAKIHKKTVYWRPERYPHIRGGHLRIFTDGGYSTGSTEGTIGVVIRIERECGKMYTSEPVLMYGKIMDATDSYITDVEAILYACMTVVKATTTSWEHVEKELKGMRIPRLAQVTKMEPGPKHNGCVWEGSTPQIIKEI